MGRGIVSGRVALLLRSTEIPPHRPNDLLPPFPLHTPGSSHSTWPNTWPNSHCLHFMPRTPGSTRHPKALHTSPNLPTLGLVTQHSRVSSSRTTPHFENFRHGSPKCCGTRHAIGLVTVGLVLPLPSAVGLPHLAKISNTAVGLVTPHAALPGLVMPHSPHLQKSRHGTVPRLHGTRPTVGLVLTPGTPMGLVLPGLPRESSRSTPGTRPTRTPETPWESSRSTPGTRPTVPLVLPGLGVPIKISRTPLTTVMRSYQGYYTRSHQNSEVKRLWAGIVLGWVTSREVPVLHPFCRTFIHPLSWTVPFNPYRLAVGVP